MSPGPDQTHAIWSSADLAGNPHAAADKASRVRAMFSAIAPRYDLNNRLHSFGRDQAWRRAAVRLARLRPGDTVLDAACGTGDLAEAFARAGAASVTGVDFAEPMLALARAKSGRRRRRGRGREAAPAPLYRQADVMDLPFEDQSFDVVSIAFGIRNVAEPAAAAAEFRRVLRPGGRLVVLEFSRPANPVLRRLNHLYCEHVMPVTATLLSGDRTGAYRYLPRSVATFAEPEALAGILGGAGFGDIIQHPLTFGVCTVTVATAKGGLLP
jgi:demethylmenaquinone methyltransferase/2-methoxy-6-polyprenyl-1,4-benzoquinol methylase